MSALSERPANAVVGQEIPHEAAALHVTGDALYTDDLAVRTHGILHAHPVQAPHAHARITRLDTAPALDGAGRRAGAHRRRRAGRQRRRGQARRAAVPVRGDVLRSRRVLGARRDPGGRPTGFARGRGRLRAAAVAGHRPRGDRGRQLPGRPAAHGARRHRRRVRGAAHVYSGEFEFAGQEHFYLETHCSIALVDENGQIFVQSSTQHPTETQDIVAHVLGLPSHAVTVQCLRMGGGFGGKEMQPHGYAAIAALGSILTGRPVRLRLTRTQDMTMSGQAARVPRPVAGRLRRQRSAPGARRHADLRRRLEPRPLRAGPRPGAVPHRQRLLDPQHPGERSDRQDAQDLPDGVPRVRWAAGHARHRGHPRPLRSPARDRPDRAAVAATSTPTGSPPPTASRSATPSGSRPVGTRCSPAVTWRRARPTSRHTTPRTSTPSAPWR